MATLKAGDDISIKALNNLLHGKVLGIVNAGDSFYAQVTLLASVDVAQELRKAKDVETFDRYLIRVELKKRKQTLFFGRKVWSVDRDLRWAAQDKAREERRVPCNGSGDPDWRGRCDNCGQAPTVPETGMCGPCTFGEADTAGGEW